MGLDQLAGCPILEGRQPGDEVPAVLGDRGLAPFANRVDQPGPGTAAYIWTSDPQRAHRLAPAIKSVSTWVNSGNPQDWQTAIVASEPSRPGAAAEHVNVDFYTQSRTLLIGGADAGLLAGVAGCRLAWWASSGAIGEPGAAG
jgi:hypothetical protein